MRGIDFLANSNQLPLHWSLARISAASMSLSTGRSPKKLTMTFVRVRICTGGRLRLLQRRDCLTPRLHPDMRVAREHPWTDMAGKLANRFFADSGILGEPGHEGMSGIVEPIIDAGLCARGLVSPLVAVGSHRPTQVDSPQMRLAPAACKADVMERNRYESGRASEKRASQRVSAAHARRVSGTARPVPAFVFE